MTLATELTEWFDNLDFDRSSEPTRIAEHAELMRIVARGAAQAAGMQEVLDFLNKIEGDGYGGMASFEIAREHVRSTLSIQHVLRPADNADHVETVGRAIEIASEASRCPPPHKTVFAEQLDIQRTASRGTSDGKTP